MSESYSSSHPFGLSTVTSWLVRLKNREDRFAWERFYADYKGFLKRIAVEAGLRHRDAEEATHEIIATLPAALEGFERRSGHGTFRKWLSQLARWRIVDLLRRRSRHETKIREFGKTLTQEERATEGVDVILDRKLETELRNRIMSEALTRLNAKFDARTLQAFHWYVILGVPAEEVARFHHCSKQNVYLAKLRVLPHFKRQVAGIRAKLEAKGHEL